MKKILVTGASGLLGLNLCFFLHKKYSVYGVCNHTHLTDAPFREINLDLLKTSPDELLADNCPDVVLHCAAMANIDQCEKMKDEALEINSIYPGKLAAAAKKKGIQFIHISTDAVFDGLNCGKDGYHEEDAATPVSRYGETKLLGEHYVLDAYPDALVARVNFYGWSLNGKRSLAEFFYNNLKAGNTINGFHDVYFNPLYVHAFADILDEMIGVGASGLYHVFSSDHQSKYEFGVSIARKFGFDETLIKPISWKDAGLTAKRSPNMIINTDKLRRLLGHDLPQLKESMDYFYRDTAGGMREKIRNYSESPASKE